MQDFKPPYALFQQHQLTHFDELTLGTNRLLPQVRRPIQSIQIDPSSHDNTTFIRLIILTSVINGMNYPRLASAGEYLLY